MKRMYRQVVIAAVMVSISDTQRAGAQCTLFFEDFSSSIGSQISATGTGGAAWSFTNSCSASNLAGHSGPGSVVFQGTTIPCQFGNSTSTVSGNLNVPALSIASTGTTTLSFNYYLINECSGTCANDKLSLLISSDNGGTYATVMDSYLTGGLAPTPGGWVAKTYNLSPYAGQTILIRFSFNSGNGNTNAFDGVYLDDIAVTATAGPATPAAIAGSGWVCMNTSATYTVSPVTAASSYSWSVPAGATINSGQGTTTVSVTYGTGSGNLSVAATNTCGVSAAKTLSVTVSVPSVTASSSSPSICQGDFIQLSAQTNTQGSNNFVDNFDPTIPSQWTNISNGTASASCGSVSGNALYFTGNGVRSATTSALNVSGGTVNFYLKIGSGGAPCEDADAGENVVLEYSINGGGTWTAINTYTTTLYSTFTLLQESIPAAAQTATTMFRWRQPTHSGAGSDNWAIDNVNIVFLSASAYSWAPSESLSDPSISNPQASPSVTTTYTVTTSGACGSVSDEVTVTVNPAVSDVDAGNNVTICEGWSAVLNASATGGSIYSWSTGQTTASIAVSPSVSSTYTLVVSNASGCSGIDDVSVQVDPVSSPNAGPDFTICSGQTFMLNGSGNGSYAWTPATGLTCTACPTPGAHPTVTTTYTLTASNNCGSMSDEVTVTVVIPVANAGNDETICPSGSIMLQATGNGSYSWTPSTGLNCTTCPDPIASPTSTTTYTLTVTNNCSSVTDEVMVVVDPLATATADAGNDVTVCASGSTTLNATGSGSYSWSPATGLSCSTCPDPVANPGSTTTYTLMVTSSCGNASDEVVITVDPSPVPTANAGNDLTICQNTSATLSASGNGSYSWAPSTGLSCSTCANPSANPSVSTSYTLTVSGNCGTAADEVFVTVDPCVTGISASKLSDDITIIPNPSDGSFTIVAGEMLWGDMGIEVTTLQGKMIYSENKSLKGNTEVDITGAAPGMYFLRLKANNNVLLKKIIIRDNYRK